MANAFQIRIAGPADAAVIADFACRLGETQGDPTDLIDEDAVRKDMVSVGSVMTVLLAEIDGEPVGYAALLPAYETSYAASGLYVSDLYVEEEHRNEGIGNRLMAAAARVARDGGGVHLWLTMMSANSEADRFYRRIADVREENVTAFAVTGETFEGLASEAQPVSTGQIKQVDRQAMSEIATRELIDRFFAAANAGDLDGMLDCLHEDVVHDLNQGERQIGKQAFRWNRGLNAKHFRESFSDIIFMAGPGGGRAAAEFTLRGTYLATAEGLPPANGQEFVLRAGMFFEIDDGLISRISVHFNGADWIEQLQSS